MLLWGPPSKFIAGHWNGKQEKGEIRPVEDFRTAELLLKWINAQLGRYDDFEISYLLSVTYLHTIS